MKVEIIGGGSIGLLFSSYFSAFHDVTILTRTDEQAKVINEKGITIVKEDHTKQTSSIQASTVTNSTFDADLVIVAVKQYHLPSLYTIFETYQFKNILFLQNGLSHLSLAGKIKANRIMVGVVDHGAKKLGSTKVQHTGVGKTRYGIWKGENYGQGESLFNELSQAFPFQSESDPLQMLKEKLLINCVINPLTALLQIKNGELLQTPYYYYLFTTTFLEASEALQLLDQPRFKDMVENVCRQTSQNTSSMYSDLISGKPTEIESIVGSVLKEAEKEGIQVPILQFLYNAVKGKEEENQNG